MNIYETVVEKYRQRMVEVAGKHGYTAEETVKVSQHLDKLLNMSTHPVRQGMSRAHDDIKYSTNKKS
ncbi:MULTISPECIES: aspartyl-phosphate phosphatase Spo0E family protein [Bacillaceae]|uniref:Aspartyl-phosphate phosphatase Spo0E family protein n=1 Tax=Metabacillus sediminis TaxID=3117746 RepID=A0ABZ2NKH4_9BACI|nr:aspartyl-phosphate phosphatase Spo0E family protein [Bacillus sp. SJS]KZZ83582.1 hypothetical protein AS29_014815 [Bacillus sp. SJS]